MSTATIKSLCRLTATQLTDLALHWLAQPTAASEPYLRSNRSLDESDEEDYLFPPARSLSELKAIWKNLSLDIDSHGVGKQKHNKQYLIDRIVDGDWRRGLSLYQHATIDFAFLSTHDTALRWTGLKIVPLEHDAESEAPEEPPSKKQKITHTKTTHLLYPTISPTTFVSALRTQVSPIVKAHYQLTHLGGIYNELPIVRLYLTPEKAFAPHQSNIPRNARLATDSGRTIYIALPRSSPHVYIAVSGTAPATAAASQQAKQAKVDITNMKRLVIEAIPKALSRRHERWALEGTKLTVRSLKSVCALRGGGSRPATAGGAFAKFFAGQTIADSDSPVDEGHNIENEDSCEAEAGPTDVLGRKRKRSKSSEGDEEHEEHENSMFFPEQPTRSEQSAEDALDAHFGPTSNTSRAKLDRVTVKITDVVLQIDPEQSVVEQSMSKRNTVDCAPVGITFAGPDVVLGLRMLAELGLVGGDQQQIGLDLDKMPGWMAGDQGQSLIVV
jgi:central kinetochore subunit Mis15/CHL4